MRNPEGRGYGGSDPLPENHKVSIEISVYPHFPLIKVGHPPPLFEKCWTPAGTSVQAGTFMNYSFPKKIQYA